MTEASCLSQHLYSPREGNINVIYKIFRYLQNNISKKPGRIIFDPNCVPIYEKLFKGSKRDFEYWKYFYPDVEEAHPINRL